MKCGTRVLYRDARRRGNGAPYRKAVRWYHSAFPETGIPDAEKPLLEICDGKIIATVAAVNEPDWGGTYANLEIAYKCETCGAQHFDHLPSNSDQLSKFVTDAIALTPEEMPHQ
jgi:hypothetical protein